MNEGYQPEHSNLNEVPPIGGSGLKGKGGTSKTIDGQTILFCNYCGAELLKGGLAGARYVCADCCKKGFGDGPENDYQKFCRVFYEMGIKYRAETLMIFLDEKGVVFFFNAYGEFQEICYSDNKTPDGIHAARELIIDALQTDGEHHKQWYLERIAEELKIDLMVPLDYEKGIAP